MSLRQRLAAALAALTLAGCAGSPGHGSGAPGTLTGGIVYTGGAPGLTLGPPGQRDYQPGVVEVRRDGRVVASQQVQEGEPYRFSLRPGVYDLHVQLGDLPCDRPAQVQPATTTTADVICSIK
jgi:hypothetical protein